MTDYVSRVRRLYKLIFRLHRGLPADLRLMGDTYARDEFKKLKKCTPQQANIFLTEWTNYTVSLAKQLKPLSQAKNKVAGQYLDPKLLDSMTDDQLVQLYEIYQATTSNNIMDTDQNARFANEKNNGGSNENKKQ